MPRHGKFPSQTIRSHKIDLIPSPASDMVPALTNVGDPTPRATHMYEFRHLTGLIFSDSIDALKKLHRQIGSALTCNNR